MTTSSEGGKGIYRSVQNLVWPDMETTEKILIQSIRHEQELTTELQKTITFSQYRELRKLSEGGSPIPWNQARLIAAIEAAANLLNNPLIIASIPEYQFFYRLFRTLELTGVLARGGNSLFIGSGITVPEVLAMYAKPPLMDDVSSVYSFSSGMDSFTLLLGKHLGIKELGGSGKEEIRPIPLLTGYSTAIEPDKKELERAFRNTKRFRIPSSKLTMLNMTLGEALDNHKLPAVQTIIWHRAEPDIISMDLISNPQAAESDVTTILQRLFCTERGRSKNQFLLTTGLGNDALTQQKRRLLLQTVAQVLPSVGAQNLTPNKVLMEEDTDLLLLGGRNGVLGCVVASF